MSAEESLTRILTAAGMVESAAANTARDILRTHTREIMHRAYSEDFWVAFGLAPSTDRQYRNIARSIMRRIGRETGAE